uniref:Protein-tyrosine phosphatase n=1 Tax=Panagrellus redivivus TaxID=6233 RepID=A0A7E4W899_PANRE
MENDEKSEAGHKMTAHGPCWLRVRASLFFTEKRHVMGNKPPGGIKNRDEAAPQTIALSDIPPELIVIERKAATRFAKRITLTSFADIVDEYAEIIKDIPAKKVEYRHPGQIEKNRYRDIPCYEPTRVVLKGRDKEHDYIHANWVKAGKYRYICSQAPLGDTVDDFWLMIANEKVGAIIMLCDLFEDGIRKCADYWPVDEGCRKTYGEVEVHNTTTMNSTLEQVTVTILRVTYKDRSHLLTHFQWVGWPDKGIPNDSIVPAKLLIQARESVTPVKNSKDARKPPAPILVHCSAGIGRTGTLVAIDMARAKVKAHANSISVPNIVKELRSQRAFAVQNPLQYTYLNACILQMFVEERWLFNFPPIQLWQQRCHHFLVEYNRASKEAIYIPQAESIDEIAAERAAPCLSEQEVK